MKIKDAMAAIAQITQEHYSNQNGEWQGLTDKEIEQEANDSPDYATFCRAARWAEQKLKEKNHD